MLFPARIRRPIVRAIRPLFVALALGAFSTPALAQFTSTVTAPRRASTADSAARADSLHRTDSASVVERMTEMREWVDSAAVSVAAAAPAPTSPAPAPRDTSVSTGTVASEADTVRAANTVTTEFREGAPAPATATPLPALALLGVASMLAGIALRRRARTR
jgi:hypothetical protein